MLLFIQFQQGLRVLTKDSSEIGDGGRSDCNQHANEIPERGRLLSWVMNPRAFMDKKLQLEFEGVMTHKSLV